MACSKEDLIRRFNALQIEGMGKVTDLNPLPGAYVNLEYTLPSGKKVKLLAPAAATAWPPGRGICWCVSTATGEATRRSWCISGCNTFKVFWGRKGVWKSGSLPQLLGRSITG